MCLTSNLRYGKMAKDEQDPDPGQPSGGPVLHGRRPHRSAHAASPGNRR